jgi:hypothetical protein
MTTKKLFLSSRSLSNIAPLSPIKGHDGGIQRGASKREDMKMSPSGCPLKLHVQQTDFASYELLIS